MYDFAIIGGGIVGLSVGKALLEKYPTAKIVILEKEKEWASHQTGHNSGVIHSGLYYKPGSYKAKFARLGNQSMVEFCQQHQIEHEICGKVVVATNEDEIPLLENLYKRGVENQLAIQKLSVEELREIEPHVNGKAAIHVPMAGIVNYKQVSTTFVKIIRENGGELRLNTKVEKIEEHGTNVEIGTNNRTYKAKLMINCAGLHSDRIANLAGYVMDMKIVPFRGEYYEIKPEKRNLVKHLIYPVPNPSFPFLGVHYTRMIGGGVEAGPNAVLSLKREGYRKTDFHFGDFLEIMKYQGFWKLARKNVKEGFEEIARSMNKKKFVESLQQLIPEITANDLVSAPAGVRAQALKMDGSLVDDFYIIVGKRSVHVCNAPSPAATASLQIGKEIVRRLSVKEHLSTFY
ncbi:L-2-hydroxyglutarate oxidase [Alkalihalobacterium elongatum]|uniref:L-2-hydroxyglutarate oxidase n=1 Tax=Alkalihalobacterium elongatum TaxID=2675466 RepID=UPI001C1F462B|nr:L-2-hydroxyglutarate oxidase [Alkalihalobacterium elongatum]